MKFTDLAGKSMKAHYNKEYKTFSTSISTKKKDAEEYDTVYLPIFFSNKCKKPTPNEHGNAEFVVKSGWFTVYSNEKATKLAVFVNEIE